MWPLWAFFAIMAVWATTPWWPEHWFRLPLMYKPKKDLAEPILPSELDDWDAEFTRLTGKSIWVARCEANPELCKSAVDLSSAQNNIPFGLLGQAMNQQSALLQQQHYRQQLAAQMNVNNSNLQGLLGGLGNIGGLFNGQRPS
jgi:hypothetical protein